RGETRSAPLPCQPESDGARRGGRSPGRGPARTRRFCGGGISPAQALLKRHLATRYYGGEAPPPGAGPRNSPQEVAMGHPEGQSWITPTGSKPALVSSRTTISEVTPCPPRFSGIPFGVHGQSHNVGGKSITARRPPGCSARKRLASIPAGSV